MTEPTLEQCSECEVIREDADEVTFAAWYPQIDGYVSKCVVTATKQPSEYNTCFDVMIWHDGEFPFSGESPVELHHCGAEQFVKFGEMVKRMAKR